MLRGRRRLRHRGRSGKEEKNEQQRCDIERRLDELGIHDRVHLLGARSDVSALWGDIDILVIPSRFESQPLVLLEGMMAGRAIVAMNVTAADPACGNANKNLVGGRSGNRYIGDF